MAAPKVLLVDDNEAIRSSLTWLLEHHGFEVVAAANVNEALNLINTQKFDVLLSDLHMPNPGDGLTVVSAMRNSNPRAVTLIFSGYPDMKEAASAILLQADEILVKPMNPETLIQIIRDRLNREKRPTRVVESVASVLEQNTNATIQDWLLRVELEPDIITVPLDYEKRTSYLPKMFHDLVHRLRHPLPLGTRAKPSAEAAHHGRTRRKQGYSAAMMVEESRMLQVSIFQTLQNNLLQIDFSLLLVGVMAIADEVDSQLAQQMAAYILESKVDDLPTQA
jgi:DNA-binding response OmpR family regulator